MASPHSMPTTVDEYIATFPPEVQAVLSRIRAVVRSAAPDGVETISYRMPAVTFHGVLVYYAAFKAHIGLYPPVTGDAALQAAAAPFAGAKGNLRFPLDQPIPYDLIERIVRHRVVHNLAHNSPQERQRWT